MANHAVYDAGRPVVRMPADSVFGLELLDRMGIDIDQDPRAFAKFLELGKMMQRRTARRISPGPARHR